MLLNQGYKKEDIRILIARAPGTTQYKCQPLKKYIMKSLEWLVKGARPTDYRYFHFSGHGEVFAVDENTQGKEARAIPKDVDNAEADDTELHTNPDAQAQVMIQKIDEAELRYYNEAISAHCPDLCPHDEPDFNLVEWDNEYRIRDQELNAIFSKLPEGCRLTCTLDCCHSARLADNNFKLKGAGFRGSIVGDVASPLRKTVSECTLSQGVSNGVDDATTRNLPTLRHHSNRSSTYPPKGPSSHYSQITNRVRVQREASSNLSLSPLSESSILAQSLQRPRYFAPLRSGHNLPVAQSDIPVVGRIKTMRDQLPKCEMERDKIIANMLTWSGCHQRQNASESKHGGYFTIAFTEAVADIAERGTKPLSVGELYEIVNRKVADRIKENISKLKQQEPEKASERPSGETTGNNMLGNREGTNLQCIQLWTSLGKGDEDSARARLTHPFII
ncbi:hypothetical protein RSOLAG22IIIB_07995 [Rhizoctonia solani]|uniref:Metacaspase-1 n=1 Tax=Rhizoctonia solani TaxID=456999 RepID=A0A0K6FRJ2_9AGAM|nr:hypothetical protein RSOLAG22IIIB_07995 [Rhizoctonia solani]